jgi:hypothetical protein
MRRQDTFRFQIILKAIRGWQGIFDPGKRESFYISP